MAMYSMQSPCGPSSAAEQSLYQASARHPFIYQTLGQCQFTARRSRGRPAAPQRSKDDQIAGSSASSQASARSNALSEGDARSVQGMQSPALGSEGIPDVLMQSAELLLIIGVAGVQGSRLLASWRQHQQAQECTHAHKHKVQSRTTPLSYSWSLYWPGWAPENVSQYHII